MGVAQSRRSKARNRRRRAMQKIGAPTLVVCPQCHELKMPHRACANCGYYKDRNVAAE
ncbi:MAG: large subunit ribosomal protein [Eubacteriales bacterium]|nr:large subunit ribosomal protein [Eubacteriales bacterium]